MSSVNTRLLPPALALAVMPALMPVLMATVIAALPIACAAQPASSQQQPGPNQATASTPSTQALPPSLTKDEAQALVAAVLHTELLSAQDPTHPMQYRLIKQSPRFSTTKLIIETKDGDVARLLAVNGQPLSPASQHDEEVRLQGLLDDPTLQHHRQEREQGDANRARKILRALPEAFLYEFAGMIDTPQGPAYRMSFQPNPSFDPHDIEAQVLKAMAGEIWIDATQKRVIHLEGKRLHDVDYGWGLLGKLDQGGTLLLEQAEVGNHQWRTTHMVLAMNARFLLKTVKLDTTLDLSQFTPVDKSLRYQQAIKQLQSQPSPNAER